MQNARTAIYLGIAIVIAVAGMSIGLSALDEAAPGPDAGGDARAAAVDKSGLRQAPELAGIAGYINTDAGELEERLEGSVVLYDIWTYSCINCIRTLPHITAWDEKYADDGLLIVGVHSPEFEFEKDIGNVRAAVEKNGIEYPVVLDNDKETWNAFENRYWPRKYIADHEGYIRYDHIGEGAYKETERVIQDLLAERAASLGVRAAAAQGLVDIEEFEHTGSRTPELYLGYKFAYGRDRLGNDEGFRPGSDVTYHMPGDRTAHHFYLDGTWSNLEDGMRLVSDSGTVRLEYHAKEVNIVAGGQAELQIYLDGAPVAPGYAGRDVEDGTVSVGEHDLYNIIDSDAPETHEIEIRTASPGFELYTFTFG